MCRHARFQPETWHKWRQLHIKHSSTRLLLHKQSSCMWVGVSMYVCLYMSACVCVDSCVKRYKQAISMPCSWILKISHILLTRRVCMLMNVLVWGSEHMCIIRLIRNIHTGKTHTTHNKQRHLWFHILSGPAFRECLLPTGIKACGVGRGLARTAESCGLGRNINDSLDSCEIHWIHWIRGDQNMRDSLDSRIIKGRILSHVK